MLLSSLRTKSHSFLNLTLRPRYTISILSPVSPSLSSSAPCRPTLLAHVLDWPHRDFHHSRRPYLSLEVSRSSSARPSGSRNASTASRTAKDSLWKPNLLRTRSKPAPTIAAKSRDKTPKVHSKHLRLILQEDSSHSNIASKAPSISVPTSRIATSNLHPTKPLRKPKRIQPIMSNKHRSTGTRIEPAARVASPVHVHEDISSSIQILCDAMEEARVNLARERPPVFVAGTYESAEMAMQLFSDYYSTVQGSPGPVGFDTETSSPFIPRKGTGVSLVQIATKDICLIFQVYRITEQNTKPERFPPRLKAFLEDKDQILAGVAASGDASELRSSYGIDCGGIVNLEKIAKQKKVLAASLADLDNMFGFPGREVVKTKAILKWNWDSPTLDPKWIWYAAKDAFAGQAIYENMMQDTFKLGYVPYSQQFPLTDEQEAEEIAAFLTRTVAKGKQTTMGTVESLITKQYPRFQKMYQPEERVDHSKKFVKLLVKNGFLIVDQDSTTPGSSSQVPEAPLSQKQERNIPVSLAGKPFSALAITPTGMAYLSKKFFRGRVVDLSTVVGKVGAAVQEQSDKGSNGENDQDQEDLRLFLRHATMWDRPHKLAALVSMYIGELTSEETQRIVQNEKDKNRRMSQLSLAEPGEPLTAGNTTEDGTGAGNSTEPTPLERSRYPKAEIDRVMATSTWQKFINRMKHKGLLVNDRHLVQLAPGVEARMTSLFEKGSMASQQPSQEGNSSASASSISTGNMESKKHFAQRRSKSDKKRNPKLSPPMPLDGSSTFAGPSSPSSSMEHRKTYHSKPHHTIQPYPRPFPEMKKPRGSRSNPASTASTPSPATVSSPTTPRTARSPQL